MSEKEPQAEDANAPGKKRIKRSLVRGTLWRMGLQAAAVIVLMTLLAYWYIAFAIERQETQRLIQYVRERAQRERFLFALTERNQTVVRTDLLQRLEELGDTDPVEDFEAMFQRCPDGVWRKHAPVKKGDEATTAYVDESLEITADVRRRMLVFEALAERYGPVWKHLFPNIYIFSEEDGMGTQYWPERADWNYMIGPEYDISAQEWAYISNPEHDPEREAVWTGLYWDKVAELWMVSCSTPVYVGDRHIGSIGQDIYLDQLIERSIEDRLEGAYNIIFRQDGRLIAHPERMDESRAAMGVFDIPQSGDPVLQRIFRTVTEHPEVPFHTLKGDDVYLAVAPIEEPGWLFVMVYPRSVVTQLALRSALGVLVLGCLSLIAEFLLLAGILRKRVGQPLQELTEATSLMAASETPVRLPLARRDEFGQLAAAFNHMAERVERLVAGLNARIEALKHAEETVRKTQRNYQEIFNASSDAVFLYDVKNGAVLDANEASEQMYGYTREEMLNLNVGDLSAGQRPYTPKDAAWLAKLAAAEGPQVIEWRAKRKDGEKFWIEASIRSTDIGGRGRILATIRDISSRKDLERQLRQAQKMEAVGQLAGGVAHDFNNLLQAILGYAEMALDETPEPGELRDNIAEVVKAAETATGLVHQLLAFSRRQVLRLEEVALDGVVRKITKMLSRVIGEHIALEVHAAPNLRSVRADRGQMEQILLNLCVNARDAMPEGGQLTIDTQNADLGTDFCRANAWAKPGKYVLLSVTDTGTGMDQETQGRIFEPFFTTKEPGKGTGLGLATVYGLVRQHQGMIHVYSEIGKGTAFRIYLPASETVESPAVQAAPPAPKGGEETVLLAEDDSAVRRLAKRILERAGYTVLSTADGEEAIGVIDNRFSEIDLALLDIVMPKLGGRAVYDHLQETHPEIRVLFASGYSAGAIPSFVLGKNMNFVSKPFQRDDLLRKVREVLDA